MLNLKLKKGDIVTASRECFCWNNYEYKGKYRGKPTMWKKLGIVVGFSVECYNYIEVKWENGETTNWVYVPIDENIKSLECLSTLGYLFKKVNRKRALFMDRLYDSYKKEVDIIRERYEKDYSFCYNLLNNDEISFGLHFRNLKMQSTYPYKI